MNASPSPRRGRIVLGHSPVGFAGLPRSCAKLGLRSPSRRKVGHGVGLFISQHPHQKVRMHNRRTVRTVRDPAKIHIRHRVPG